MAFWVPLVWDRVKQKHCTFVAIQLPMNKSMSKSNEYSVLCCLSNTSTNKLIKGVYLQTDATITSTIIMLLK